MSYFLTHLPSGHEVKLDLVDAEFYFSRIWFVAEREHLTYVTSDQRVGSKRGMLHRLLLSPPKRLVVDHINGDGLDNRRENLRICTAAQNNMNSRKRSGHKPFRGVYYSASRGHWWSQIYSAGVSHYGGSHLTAELAALAYDEMARRYHGEFASLNFPERSQ